VTEAAEPGRIRPFGRPNATIEDVAVAAGVGRQTVSNVLNGSGRVGEAARARVIDRALRQVAEGPAAEPGEIVPFTLGIGRSA
jgi:hypothetical protein